jgi:hypothetical protein
MCSYCEVVFNLKSILFRNSEDYKQKKRHLKNHGGVFCIIKLLINPEV